MEIDGRVYESFDVLTAEEAVMSSCMRELLGLQRMLEALGHLLAGRVLRLCCDGSSAIRCLEVGSRLPHPHRVAVAIRRMVLLAGATLCLLWMPREAPSS